MRKLVFFIILITFLFTFDIIFALPNPAAVYCKQMGYEYKIVKTTQEESGECIFPDKTNCDDWEFLKGKCGQEYSYCKKNGYDIKTVKDGKNPYSYEYAVCVPKKAYQKEMTVTDFIELNTDLISSKRNVEENLNVETTGIKEGSTIFLPTSFDWRNVNDSNWMTPVKNQGSCGSCWDFAAVGCVEAKIKIENNTPFINPDLSEQDVLSCGSGTCNGGLNEHALDYIQNTGIVDETCFPYTANDLPCSDKCSDWQNRVFKIGRWLYVPYGSNSKEYIIQKGPLTASIGMRGYLDSKGIYKCDGNVGCNHAVIIVGYNDTDGYWIVKNSWGTDWGENGYFKVYYGNCNIRSDEYVYAFGEKIPPNPVTDLSVINSSATSITLEWTSVSDIGIEETVDYYVIKYSTSYDINEDNFNYLPAYYKSGDPEGVKEKIEISTLQPNTTYYFAIKAYDIFSNPSNISNVASGSTTLPKIKLFDDDTENGNLAWTAIGTDGKGGPTLWHITEHKSSSPTHSWYYGIENQWNYDTGSVNNGSLISPIFDISNYSQIYLILKYSADLEPRNEIRWADYFDGSYWLFDSDEVRKDGIHFDFENRSTNDEFIKKIFRLGDFGKKLQISFNFNSIDELYNDYEGIYLDDIKLYADNYRPIAIVGGPYLNYSGLSITFDGSSSYDSDGDYLTYFWNFGDNKNGFGKIITHTYDHSGIYNVSLIVGDGKSSSESFTNVTVINLCHEVNGADPECEGVLNETSWCDGMIKKICDANCKYSETCCGDINNDKIVDIFDIAVVALAFGSKPGDNNWNSLADVNKDNIIDIFDVVFCSVDFGKEC